MRSSSTRTKSSSKSEFVPVWDKLGTPASAKLIEKENENNGADENSLLTSNQSQSVNTTCLFVGKKKCGKTTLVERFINPSKEDFPKSTVALDYKFVRTDAAVGSGKNVAHLYDSGLDVFADLVVKTTAASSSSSSSSSTSTSTTTSSSSTSSNNMLCCVVLDGSEPGNILQSFLEWTSLLRSKIAAANPNLSASTRPDLQPAEVFEKFPNKEQLRPFPVPLLIVVAKYDLMIGRMDAELRKVLIRGLRFFAHILCGHFVTTAVQEKTSMNNYRGILKGLLFNTPPTAKPCLDMTKPLCIPAGSDSLEKIGPPIPGAASEPGVWQKFLEKEVPKQKSKDDKEQVLTNEELAKFPDSAIDGMVVQKGDELIQYKREAERRYRLEGA
ncbi:unnamed protein product [Amoebophrya sp. A120]|nr:unnamed protein product [Amoebophrya sp. A120]|eukprot:GSA120T00007251001.1